MSFFIREAGVRTEMWVIVFGISKEWLMYTKIFVQYLIFF
jgi:hypothetical protein